MKEVDLSFNDTLDSRYAGDIEFLEPFFVSPTNELCRARLPAQEGTSIVKRLPVAYRYDVGQHEHFYLEFRFQEALDHEGIAKPDAFLRFKHEVAHLFIPGDYWTLTQIRTTCDRLKRRIPLAVAVCMIEQILHTLAYLQEKDTENALDGLDIVLHPDALLVDTAGRVLVTLIGLANPPYITSSILGTETKRYFQYAAPEQCVAGRTPDRNAGLYTFGMLCFELLTSQPLFSTTSASDLDSLVRRKLRLLHPLASDVDPALSIIDDFITKLLDPLPENRLTELDAIREAIEVLRLQSEHYNTQDIVVFRRNLENALRDAMSQMGGADVTGQLTAVTDILEYNAS